MNTNITFITLDSLRWDTLVAAKTPNIAERIHAVGARWHKVYAQGTYTLPVHVALFQDGHLPSNDLDPNEDKDYSRRNFNRVFNISLGWNKERNAKFKVPEAENLIKGFEKLGYTTIGIGGVGWFRTDFKTTSLWNQYFQRFYWSESFHEKNPDAFEKQLDFIIPKIKEASSPLLYFHNIPSMHVPCRGNNTQQGQVQALEYVDSHINKLFEVLPKPNTVFLFSDHGTCFGEEGLVAHGFYHPLVLQVPMVIFTL